MGVNLLGHFIGAEDDIARFEPDLADIVAFGDEPNRAHGSVRKLVGERGLGTGDPRAGPFEATRRRSWT